jgi:hypothetical protein
VTITVIGAFGGTLGGLFIIGLFLPCINKVVSDKWKWTIFIFLFGITHNCPF